MFNFFRKISLAEVARPIDPTVLRRRIQVLVVDDNKASWQPFERLKQESYNITFWEKIESIERLERGDFDVIILDIGGVAGDFGGQDGLEILQVLKEHNPSQVIIAYSGQTFDVGKRAFWLVADDALPKPADPIKCKEVLDHAIREKITVKHYWSAAAIMLKNAGLTDSEIARMESQIARAFSKGKQDDAKAIIKKFISGAELAARVTVIVAKVGALFAP